MTKRTAALYGMRDDTIRLQRACNMMPGFWRVPGSGINAGETLALIPLCANYVRKRGSHLLPHES